MGDGQGREAEFTNLSEMPNQTSFVVDSPEGLRFKLTGSLQSTWEKGSEPCYGTLPYYSARDFGSPDFIQEYGTACTYMLGAMANAIASVDLVIAAGKAGFLGTFGSGGVPLEKVKSAIEDIQLALPSMPYAFNLLNSPMNPAREMELVEMYLHYEIRTIEASAFLKLSVPLVYYRVKGLYLNSEGIACANNRIIAKISRPEVAKQFMKPAPEAMVQILLDEGKITTQQANLAKAIPMAHDITVEADSGGHTDRRPLISLLPSIISLRESLSAKHPFVSQVRIGAAGGICTPASALAAYSLGAAYIVTGSINQCCIEAGTSSEVKRLLAQAQMADVTMAPAADMFEMGSQVQVLKRGTMYGLNAAKLMEIYRSNNSIADFSNSEQRILETRIFKKTIDEVWEETRTYFKRENPQELEKSASNPKYRIALLFRWYLGNSSKWAVTGDMERVLDFQIWCGQAMGAFNNWVMGTPLENPGNRYVASIGTEIMNGAVDLKRLQQLRELGCRPN